MNNCRDNLRRNGGQENWNQMHNPRFTSNKQRHEFHGFNIRPPNPRQWRPDSSFRGRDQRWGMHPPNNQYGAFNFRSMPFPRPPSRFAWNVNHQNEFGPPHDYHPQNQVYQEFDQDVGEQNSSKPREHLYDKNLNDTIDSVKRKLSARQANMAAHEIAPVEDPQFGNNDLLKSSEKRRIEHSRMLPKAATAKKSERRESLAVKLKNYNALLAPPNLLQKKSQMMRRKILQQLFKMNKNDLRKVLSHPDSSTKYDFALQSLIKETRDTLSRQLRAVAEKSLQHYDTSADPLQGEKIVQDAFMGHLETMLDTDASLELSNMEPQVIAELSKVLQEDLMGPTGDDSVIPSFAHNLHEPVSEESIQNSANKQRCFDEARKDDDTFLLHINNEIQASIFKGDSIFTGFQLKNENQEVKSWKDYLLIQPADSPSGDNNSDNFGDVSENRYSNFNAQNVHSEFSGECSNWRTSQIPEYCINTMNSAPQENDQFSGNSNSDAFPAFSNFSSNTTAGSDLSNSKLHMRYHNASTSNQYDGYSADHFYQRDIEIDRGYVTKDHFTEVKTEKDSNSRKIGLYKDSKISSGNNFEDSFNYSNDRNRENQPNYRSNSGTRFPNEEVIRNTVQSMDCDMREFFRSSETLADNPCTNPASSEIVSPEMDNISTSSLEISEEPMESQRNLSPADETESHRASDISIACRNAADSIENVHNLKNTCIPDIIKTYENTAKRRRTNSHVNILPSEPVPLNLPCVKKTNEADYSETVINPQTASSQQKAAAYPIERCDAENQTQSIDRSENKPVLKSICCQTVQPESKSKGTQSHNIGKTNASSQVYASLIHSKSKGTQYSSSSIKTCSCQNSSSKEYSRNKSAKIGNKQVTARDTQTDSPIASQSADFACQASLPAQELARPNKTGKSFRENDNSYLDVPYKSLSILEQMKLIDNKIQILIQEKFKLYNKLENSNTKLKKILAADISSSHRAAIRFQKSSKVSSHKKINASQKNDPRLSESSKVLRQSLAKPSKNKIISGKDESLYRSKGNQSIKSAETVHKSRKKISESQEIKDLNLPFPSTSTPRNTRRTRSQDSDSISKSDDPVSIANTSEIKAELEKMDLSACEEDYLAAFQEYGDIDNICLETLGFPMSLDGDFVAFDEAFDVKNIDTIADDHSLIKTSMEDDNFQCGDPPENNTDAQSACEGSDTPVSIDLEKSNSSSCTSNKSIIQEKFRGEKNTQLENNPTKNELKASSNTPLNNRINRKNISTLNKKQKSFASLLETIDCDLQNVNTKDKKNTGKRSRTTSETKSINGANDKNATNKSEGSNKASKKEKSDQNISLSNRMENKDESSVSNDKKKSSKHGDKFSNIKDINSKNRYISRISDSKIRIINRPAVSGDIRNSPNTKLDTKKEITKPVRGRSSNRFLNTNIKMESRSNNQSVRGKKIIQKNIDKELNKNSPLCSLMSQLDDSDNESDLDLTNIEKPANVESITSPHINRLKEDSISDNVDLSRESAQSDWNEFAIKECTVVLDRIDVPLVENPSGANLNSSSIFNTDLKDVSTVRFKDHNKDFPISIYQVKNAANKSSDELDVSNVIGVIGASDTLDIINNWDSLIFDNVSGCDNMEVYANETVIIEDESAPVNAIRDVVPPVKNEECVELKNNIDDMNDFDIGGSAYPINYTDHKDSIIAIECIENRFLAASLDGNVYHYSTTDKSLLRTFNVSELAVTSLCIIKQKSQNLFYAGSLDSYLRCYNIESGVKSNADVYIGSPIQSMYHSMDTIYVGTRTGVISQFDLKTNALLPDKSIKFADNAILALHAIKEGARKVLLVASRSQKVTVRDANTGLLLRMFNGPDSTIYSLLFDSGRVICGTNGSDIQIFDFVTGEITAIHKGGNGAVCLKMYRGLLFVGCYDGKIYIFKVGFADEPVACIPGPGKMLLAMAIKDDKIIAGCNDHSLCVWSLPNEVLKHLDSH